MKYISIEFSPTPVASVDFAGNDPHSLGVQFEILGVDNLTGEPTTIIIGVMLDDAYDLYKSMERGLQDFIESYPQSVRTLFEESRLSREGQ